MHRTDMTDTDRAHVAPLVFTPGRYAVVLVMGRTSRSVCETTLVDALMIADAFNASDTRTEQRNPGDYYADKARQSQLLAAVLEHDSPNLKPHVVDRVREDLERARYVGD